MSRDAAFDFERFNRLLGIVDPRLLAKLANTHVLIAGVGGSGGQLASDLARMGVGHLTLADFDVYERHNMNRQIGCFESTLGRPKIDVVAEMCLDINPGLRIRKVPEGVTERNAAALLEATEDFPAPVFAAELIDILGLKAKLELYRACRKAGVTALTAPMLGFGSAVFVFRPEGPSFEDTLSDGRHLRFDRLVPHLGAYVNTQQLKDCVGGQATTPTCITGATLAAGLMLSEIMRGLMQGMAHMVAVPEYSYVDLFERKFVRGTLPDLAPAAETASC